MDLTPLVPAGRQIIESYGDLRFRVTGVLHEGSILVFPDRTEIWSLVAIDALTVESLAAVGDAGRRGAVDLLLIGCGARISLIPKDLRAALRATGVVIEAMDTGAACRTYNVLAAEGRRVAAALIAV